MGQSKGEFFSLCKKFGDAHLGTQRFQRADLESDATLPAGTFARHACTPEALRTQASPIVL